MIQWKDISREGVTLSADVVKQCADRWLALPNSFRRAGGLTNIVDDLGGGDASMRIADTIIQKLRKDGVIVYTTHRGWITATPR